MRDKDTVYLQTGFVSWLWSFVNKVKRGKLSAFATDLVLSRIIKYAIKLNFILKYILLNLNSPKKSYLILFL